MRLNLMKSYRDVNVTGSLTLSGDIKSNDSVSRIKINGDTIVINLQD